MEWGIIVTGFYLIGFVVLVGSAINAETAPSGQESQPGHTNESDALQKQAA